MNEHIKKIRTIDGDKQIDYEALANLPDLLELDDTLTESGKAADAKVVGNKLDNIINNYSIAYRKVSWGSSVNVTDASISQPNFKLKIASKNLFDKSNYKLISNIVCFDISNLVEGVEYTLSSNLPLYRIKISSNPHYYSTIEHKSSDGITKLTFRLTKHSNIDLDAPQYLILGVTSSFSTNISDFNDYNIKIELGDVATTYSEYISPTRALVAYNGTSYTPNADGSISNLNINLPITQLETSEDFNIIIEYNCNIGDVIYTLTKAIEALGGTV